MSNLIANRIKEIKPSATFAITAKANQLRKEGKDVISLGAGEPDCDTPDEIKQAAIKAINDGFTKYTPIDGTIELKEAIAKKLKNDNQLDYDLNQIIVSTGAKQSIFNTLFALLNPGDEVILIPPYWVSYPEMVKLAGGVPITVEASISDQFKLKPENLAKVITTKTRLIVLNSPSNPTGVAYSHEELRALGDVLAKHPNVFIISDDIYEHTVWNGKFSNIAMSCPELKDRCIVINGVSKAYSMTGWRIGYAAGPKELVAGMKLVQSQSTSSPNSIAQKAATKALQLPIHIVNSMVDVFQKRHSKLYPALQQIPGIKVIPSDGTFYTFPDISEIIEKYGFKDDLDFCSQLLEKQQLAVVPGTAFGSPNHCRLSFAVSDELLKKAADRLQSFVISLDS